MNFTGKAMVLIFAFGVLLMCASICNREPGKTVNPSTNSVNSVPAAK